MHPIQSEAVISLYGRADQFVALFTLYALQTKSFRSKILCGFLSTLSKETGLATFLLVAVQMAVERRVRKMVSHGKCQCTIRFYAGWLRSSFDAIL